MNRSIIQLVEGLEHHPPALNSALSEPVLLVDIAALFHPALKEITALAEISLRPYQDPEISE